MIVGLGFDLVELERIRFSLERFGPRFLEKLLHATERSDWPELPDLTTAHMVARVAGRFAAKEAGAKALGSGFAAGVGPHDIRIATHASGKPLLAFYGEALLRANALCVTGVHLSISHARATAGAVVVLESGSGLPVSGVCP